MASQPSALQPTSSIPHVAICMAGAERTLALPFVANSIKKNLLDQQIVRADLFALVHLDHPGATLQERSGSPALQRALALLQPTWVNLTTTSECDNPILESHPLCMHLAGKQPAVAVALKERPAPYQVAAFLQYAWWAHTFRVALAHGDRVGRPYAFLVRTRPDVAFFDAAPPALGCSRRRLTLTEKESAPGYFDAYFVAPRALARELPDAVDAFFLGADVLPWPPEWHFFPWLRNARAVPWTFAPVPAVIVRSESSADCFRTRRGALRGETVYDLEDSAWGRAADVDDASSPGGADLAPAVRGLVPPDEPWAAGPRLLSFAEACERFMRESMQQRFAMEQQLAAAARVEAVAAELAAGSSGPDVTGRTRAASRTR